MLKDLNAVIPQERGKMKMRLFVAVWTAIGLASIDSANARINCNHDPVCQANRDGTTVETAQTRDRALTGCLKSFGYTLAQWRAYAVPAPYGTRVRECVVAKSGWRPPS